MVSPLNRDLKSVMTLWLYCMFDLESRIWSRAGAKVHAVIPREITRGEHFQERIWTHDLTTIIPQLREIWANLISRSTRKDGKLGLDTFTWLNKVTLDVIGLAGDPFFV